MYYKLINIVHPHSLPTRQACTVMTVTLHLVISMYLVFSTLSGMILSVVLVFLHLGGVVLSYFWGALF